MPKAPTNLKVHREIGAEEPNIQSEICAEIYKHTELGKSVPKVPKSSTIHTEIGAEGAGKPTNAWKSAPKAPKNLKNHWGKSAREKLKTHKGIGEQL